MANQSGSGKAAEAGAVTNNSRGRFAGTGKLTPMQRRFVRHLVRNGGNKRRAAIAAGASESRANSAAHEWLNKSHIREALRKERESILSGELAPLALDAMRELITGQDTPAGVRFNAARYTLEASGHNSQGNSDLDSNDGRSLEELSIDELERVISQGQQAIDAYHREQSAIDVTPDRADSGQTGDTAPIPHDDPDSDVLN